MLLLRDEKVQFCPTLLLVVIIVLLLSYVVRKFDFYISEYKYILYSATYQTTGYFTRNVNLYSKSKKILCKKIHGKKHC